jgi:hypothetical protein
MIVHEPAAGKSIHYLEQGVELIRCLDPRLYADCPDSPFPGGVGAQLRHCIDFYDCLLTGFACGRVDYTGRRRDPRVETDPDLAQQRIEKLILELSKLSAEDAERELLVRTEVSTSSTGDWTRSTLRRELDFLVSHTIHHFALIVALLAMHGFKIPRQLEGFGVAPSTLRHWSESGQPAE